MSEMERSVLSFESVPIRRRALFVPRRRLELKQHGGIAVVFAALLLVLLGFCGLVVDLSRLYNRKAEMQSVADAVALAAAKKLNGTAGGVTAAVAAATTAATSFKYDYGNTTISWSSSALKFSTARDPDGNWVDSGAAAATASKIFYVKVDTREFGGVGDVEMLLMPVVSASLAPVSAGSVAIAGRTTINVDPLAICAMSTTPAASRNNSASYVELVEYGFRRGVSYDLMKLNPGAGGAAHYVINPLAAPGTTGSPSDTLPSKVGPYVCAGALGIPRLMGDTIAVSEGFPLGFLYKQLNSRFDQYEDGLCHFRGAPPDFNIKPYAFAGLSWVGTALNGQTAEPAPTAGKMETYADLPPPLPNNTAAKFGPIWAYAKAVPYSAYSAGVLEPYPSGYTTFTTAAWADLYGGQTPNSYPGSSTTPYKATTGSNFAPPDAAHKPGVKGRRVLNVPLLSCPVAGSATVVAVGKFFMTIPATATSLPAEFAGVLPVERIEGRVELFQ